MKEKYQPIQFPQDESAHDKIIEWWYFNAHLWDENQNHYALMYAFFKANPRKVKLPVVNKIPLKNIYFEHSMISDIKNQKFYATINPICILMPNGFSRALLFINYLTQPNNFSRLTEIKPFTYQLETKNINLSLASAKKPLLVNQIGFVDLKFERQSWYYSLSRLNARGKIKIKDQWLKVAGQALHDHQWANAPYANDFWLWFSIQLDNGVEIVCFEYGREAKTSLASVMNKNGVQKTFSVEITPIGENWTSPVTAATYPQKFEIKIPQAKIEMVVKSLVKNQEMLYGLINYWEGGVEVSAKIEGQAATGWGFAELVGFKPNKKFAKIYQEKFKAELNSTWLKLKNKAQEKIQKKYSKINDWFS